MGQIIFDLISLLRLHHWVKNLLVIAPPYFAGILFDSKENIIASIIAFFSFSLASSTAYIFNDLLDIKTDSIHPHKKDRPIVSGRISLNLAIILLVIVFFISALLAMQLNIKYLIIIAVYLLISSSYSLYFKNIVILESFFIATGFVLRIAAGGIASDVTISSWLFLTTIVLSLLLAFGKRRTELSLISQNIPFRPVLSEYNKSFLDTSIAIFSSTSIVTFSLYAVEKGPKIFIITIPLVCFGVLRYIYLVQIDSRGDPTEVLIRDKWLLLSVFIWLLISGGIIYFYDFFSFLEKVFT